MGGGEGLRKTRGALRKNTVVGSVSTKGSVPSTGRRDLEGRGGQGHPEARPGRRQFGYVRTDRANPDRRLFKYYKVFLLFWATGVASGVPPARVRARRGLLPGPRN